MNNETQAPVDLTQLRIIADDDKDVERQLLTVFITQSDKNIETLKESREDGKGQQWKETAHMFKGASGGVGAEALRQLCEKAQHLDFSATAERKALFDKIAAEYARVKKFLEQEMAQG
jgi:HPt (histidine-containing phosphotransfer) domain-containing protein